MKIYAIFGDNNERWDDYWYEIMKEHIYSNPKDAEEMCFKLNNKVFVPEFIESDEDWKFKGYYTTYKEYLAYEEKSFNNKKWTYTVKELNVIT